MSEWNTHSQSTIPSTLNRTFAMMEALTLIWTIENSPSKLGRNKDNNKLFDMFQNDTAFNKDFHFFAIPYN